MCGAFGLSAILQFNDPDPIIWVIIYGSATSFSAAYHSRITIDWKLFGIFSLITFIWGLILFFDLDSTVNFLDLFEEFSMKNSSVEVGRESGGLFLISIWNFILTINIRNQI
tara:strand:+ start:14892 stop:15227 length:336 start_codon:yes stop_codon:yes gene_type:complete